MNHPAIPILIVPCLTSVHQWLIPFFPCGGLSGSAGSPEVAHEGADTDSPRSMGGPRTVASVLSPK